MMLKRSVKLPGKTVDEIPGFYDVLELYPGDGTRWD